MIAIMVRLHRSNADTIEDIDVVVIGVPDESGSHAKRKGTSRAPDVLRIASNESEFFERGGKLIPTCPMRGTFNEKHIFDAGNVGDGKDLHRLVLDIISRNKL